MKQKKKGNIRERFIQSVKCATCPHETRFFKDYHIYTEADSLSVTLHIEHDIVSYELYLSDTRLLKAERGEELATFAEREIRKGISGILHILKNNPFAEHEEWLKDFGCLTVTYGQDS